MKAETVDVLLAECFSLSRAQPCRRIDIDEFGIPRERKSLLDGIGDHHEMAACPACGNTLDRSRNRRRIGEKVANQNGLGTARQVHGCGQLLRRVPGGGFLCQQNFREPFDDISDRESGRQAKKAHPLATAHEKIGGGEAEHERAIYFRLQREIGRKPHGRGAIDPEENRMRRFPFALANIETFVLRRAAPINPARSLARDEGAKLPKSLALAGAPSSMDTMQDARGNLSRRGNEAGQSLRHLKRMILVAPR
jgi:hypothetical protein